MFLLVPPFIRKVTPDLPILCKHSLAWPVLYSGQSFYTSHDFGGPLLQSGWSFLHGDDKRSATFTQWWWVVGHFYAVKLGDRFFRIVWHCTAHTGAYHLNILSRAAMPNHRASVALASLAFSSTLNSTIRVISIGFRARLGLNARAWAGLRQPGLMNITSRALKKGPGWARVGLGSSPGLNKGNVNTQIYYLYTYSSSSPLSKIILRSILSSFMNLFFR